MRGLLIFLFGGAAIAGLAAYGVMNDRKKKVDATTKGASYVCVTSPCTCKDETRIFAGETKSPIVFPFPGPPDLKTPPIGSLEPSTAPIAGTLTATGQASSIFAGDASLQKFGDNQAGYSTDSLLI